MITLVVILSAMVTMKSQTKSAKDMVIRTIPSEYENGPYRVLGKDVPRLEKARRPWSVFSDRSHNVCYDKPDIASNVIGELSFRQVCFVVDETDDFVLLAEYDKFGYANNTKAIIKDLKLFGWVPKENVLLWSKAVIHPETKFIRKVIAVNTIPTLNDVLKYSEDEKLKLFTAPQGSERSDLKINLYTFAFIMKEQDGYFLIAKSTYTTTVSAQNDILGWVSKDIIQEWGQRMAMEPSTHSAQERKSADIPVKLFTSEADALAYHKNPKYLVTNLSEIPFVDKYEKRYSPSYIRFPVFSISDGNPRVVHTGVVTPIFNDKGEAIIDAEEQIELNKEYESKRDKKSNINIVFVMDGSQSMQAYAKAVCTSIRDATVIVSEVSGGNANIEFGAVAYRAVSELACGNAITQQQQLTVNEQEVIDFLAEDVVRIDCGPRAEYKAVYRGLSEGLDMMSKSMQLNETNVIILIGGEGNDPNDNSATREQIESKMTKLNCSLMCFQVKNNGDPTYLKFTNDFRDLLVNSERSIRSSYSHIYPIMSEINYVSDAMDADLVRMPFPETAPVPGFFIWSPPNQAMNVGRLKNEITRIIVESIENNERLFAKSDSQIKGVGKRFEMDESTRNFLSTMKVDVDLLLRASQSNIQFFIEGYTCVENIAVNGPMLDFVLFTENLEFMNLIDKMETLIDDNNTSNTQRRELEESFKTLAQTYIGSESSSKINNMTMETLFKRMFGLPGSDGIPLLKKRIDEIENLSGDEIRELVNYFSEKKKRLEEYREKSENQLMREGQIFYWIPQEILP